MILEKEHDHLVLALDDRIRLKIPPGDGIYRVHLKGQKVEIDRDTATFRINKSDDWHPGERIVECRFRSSCLDETFPPPAGLGDYISTALHSFGLTKERFSILITLGKTEEGCNCKGRHAIANWVGERLGLAPGRLPELHDLLLAEEMQPQKVCHCSYFQAKCLPNLRLDRDLPLAKAIQGSGYHCCPGCPAYSANPLGSQETGCKLSS